MSRAPYLCFGVFSSTLPPSSGLQKVKSRVGQNLISFGFRKNYFEFSQKLDERRNFNFRETNISLYSFMKIYFRVTTLVERCLTGKEWATADGRISTRFRDWQGRKRSTRSGRGRGGRGRGARRGGGGGHLIDVSRTKADERRTKADESRTKADERRTKADERRTKAAERRLKTD